MAQHVQQARATAARWTSVNPILWSGEMGVEKVTGLFKIGDGATAWNSLPYGGIVGATGADGADGDTGAQGNIGVTGAQGASGSQGSAGAQGEVGAQGTTGAQGAQGTPGAAGPNNVTTTTSTNITGIIKGNGSVVSQAIANTDYQSPLGFTPENIANKDTDATLAANSDTKFASQKATKAYADAKVVDAINDGATNSAPSQNAVFDALALKASQISSDSKAPIASPTFTGTVSGITKSMVGLPNVANLDTSTTTNITDALNKRFVTDAQKAAIGQAAYPSYTHVTSGTVVPTSVNSTPSMLAAMTLSPVAGRHKVTFNGQYSATAASMTAQAASDLTAAYNALQAMPATGTHTLVFNTETVTPGVYAIPGAGSLPTATTLTLDGQGNPNSVFVFRMVGAFSTGASAVVVLANGAQASNVFWVAQGAITLGASTILVGTLLSPVAVSTAAGCTVNGRLSSLGGAVGIATSTVNKPTTSSQIALGAFAGFAMFTNAGGASAAGVCSVTGDVGTNAGAITGFESSTVDGNFYTSASISSVFTLGIYNNGVLVPFSSRATIAAQSTQAATAILEATVDTLAGQSLEIRVKVDSGSMTTGNRIFTTTQVGP